MRRIPNTVIIVSLFHFFFTFLFFRIFVFSVEKWSNLLTPLRQIRIFAVITKKGFQYTVFSPIDWPPIGVSRTFTSYGLRNRFFVFFMKYFCVSRQEL